VTLDREDLKRWYREAMLRRLEELRSLREGLLAEGHDAYDAARAVAQALRGSGATFGYPELSAAAAHVESAPDDAVMRRTEGLIAHVRRLVAGPDAAEPEGAEWLLLAAAGAADGSEGFPDLQAAWTIVALRHGLGQDELAGRVADLFGLRQADLSRPNRAALRLVPEALIRSEGVLPLGEDSQTITVATADPTSLDMEVQLSRLTGRSPHFVVASPEALQRAVAATLDQAPYVPGPARPARLRAQRSAVEKERILIVDDEPAARVLARSVLEKGGYDVEEAGDGLEALELLGTEELIALVVADLNMPRMDGLELIWEMRDKTEWSHVPVIVVTGETDEILETKLIEEGADDYIRKPLDPRLFLARVTATIRRAEV
jgi:CheY-like chemotaxis protein/HPt (histidine-containing phosphotransfer) domain-containing protein